MARIEVVLGTPQEKKHSIRYDALSGDAAVSTVYIFKKALPKEGIPTKVKITIEEVLE